MVVRRVISLTALLVALPTWLVLLPLWVLIAAVVDIASGLRRLPLVRLGLFAGVYLFYSWYAVGKAFLLWLGERFGGEKDLVLYRRMQGHWALTLLRSADRLLGIHLDWDDLTKLPDESFVLLSRHASMADAVLPAALMAGKLDRFVHYVLKQELRWDPSLDLYGTPLGNHFVTRDSGRTTEQTDAILRLAQRAHEGSALVIFPEGTYATDKNKERVLASLSKAASGDSNTAGAAQAALTLAKGLKHLLPPKPAGTLAMLEGAPQADVVVVGHVGLEGVGSFGQLRRQVPLDRTVKIRWWSYPRPSLPTEEADLQIWLNQRWQELDRWVEETRSNGQSDDGADATGGN